ncbi:MAG: peptidase, partial [Verrucomicrobia bacterium]|nr:peptidase [Verrucomicrobiota bacterium]
GSKQVVLTLSLPAGWRAKSDISRRVGTWPMRGMATGGMVLVDLSDEERTARGLAKDRLGLFVKGLGQYGKHAAAKNAGFQKDDVLVEIHGQSARVTEGELIGQFLQQTKPGDKIKTVVLRGDKRIELLLPMQ